MKQIPKYKEVSKKYSNMNVEVGEKTLLPTGLLVDHGGDKHSEGGTDVNLPEGAMIFSNAMKLDKNVVALLLGKDKSKVKRMTPAELAKKYATNELLENIESPDKYKANSAKLMLEKNIAQLNSIFQAQEEHKKVNGIESGKTLAEQGMKAEYGTAKYGGIAQVGSYNLKPFINNLPKTNAISFDQIFDQFNYGVTSPILPEDMDMYEAYQASEQANADKWNVLNRPAKFTVLPTGEYSQVNRDQTSGSNVTFVPAMGIGFSQPNKKQIFGFPSSYVNDGVVKNENIGKFLDEQVSFDRASGKYDLSTPENIGKNQQVLQHLISGDYDHIPSMNAYKDHYTVIVSDGKQKYRVKGSTPPTDPALLALPEIDSASVLSNLNNYTVELPSPDGKIANAFGHNWNYDDGINIFDTQTNYYEPGANIKEFSVGDPKTWASQTPVKPNANSTTPEIPKKPMTDYAIKSHNQIAADLYRRLFSAEMQAPYEIFNPGIAPVVRPAYQSTAPVQQALNNLSYTLDNSNASTQYGNALYAEGLAKSLDSANQISRYNQQAAMEAEQRNAGSLVGAFNQNQQGFAANANQNNLNFLRAKDRYEHYKDDLFSRVLENQVDRNTYEGMLQDRRLTERYSPSELVNNNPFNPQRYMNFDNKDFLDMNNYLKLQGNESGYEQQLLDKIKNATPEEGVQLSQIYKNLFGAEYQQQKQSGGYLKKKVDVNQTGEFVNSDFTESKPFESSTINKNTGEPAYIHDFRYTPDDINYLNQRYEFCPEGDCLQVAFDAYDQRVGNRYSSSLFPNELAMKKSLGMESLKYNSKTGESQYAELSPEAKKRYDQIAYMNPAENDFTADSWDVHGVIKSKGGTNLFTDINNEGTFNKLSPKEKEKIYKKIPVGALIGFGGLKAGSTSDRGINKDYGLANNRHSAMVVGYADDGVPVMYDYHQYRRLDDPYFKDFDELKNITNISYTKEVAGKTRDFLQRKGLYDTRSKPLEMDTTKLNKFVDSNESGVFKSTLTGLKSELMNDLDISNKDYDRYAKLLTAISVAETKGGSHWEHNLQSTVAPLLGFSGGLGDTQGLTQLNINNIINNPKLKKIAEKYDITEESDLFDSKKAAIASMIYAKSLDGVARESFKKGENGSDRVIKYNPRSKAFNTQGFYVEETDEYIPVFQKNPLVNAVFGHRDIEKVQAQLDEKAPGRYQVLKDGNTVKIKKKTFGNKKLSEDEKFIYAWQSPATLATGDAQGNSEYVNKVKKYLNMIK